MVNLAPLNVRITADPDNAIAGLKRVEGQLESTERAAVSSGRNISTAGGSLRALGPAAAGSSNGLRMLSMQLSQVASQGAATGNYLQALIIQAPDLALGFGAMGIAVGAAIPVLYGVAQGFLQASTDGRTLDETLEDLGSAVSALQGFSDQTRQSLAELAETFGTNAAAARENLRVLTELAGLTAIEELKASVSSLSEELGNTVNRFIEFGEAGGHAQRTAIQAMHRLGDELRLSQNQLLTLNLLFENLSAATTLEEATAHAQALGSFLTDVYGSADQIPSRLRAAAQAAAEAANAGYQIETALESARLKAFDVKGAVAAITGATNIAIEGANGLTTAWGNVALNAWEAAKAAALAQVAPDAPGATMRPRARPLNPDFGMLPPSLVTGGVGGAGGGGAGGSGGGGGVNPLIAELEAVQQALMTQEELQLQSFERQQETLQQALEQRLLTQQEYNALVEDAQRQHADRMAELDAYRYGTGLDQAEAFFGDAAQALASGNQKMVEISRKFAAAEALINAGRAFAQVASDPSLPWFAKIPAALGVASAISQFASKSGIGGSIGAAGIGGQQQAAQAAPSQYLNVTLEGDSFGRNSVSSLFDMINEGLDQGYNFKGIRLV